MSNFQKILTFDFTKDLKFFQKNLIYSDLAMTTTYVFTDISYFYLQPKFIISLPSQNISFLDSLEYLQCAENNVGGEQSAFQRSNWNFYIFKLKDMITFHILEASAKQSDYSIEFSLFILFFSTYMYIVKLKEFSFLKPL